MNSCVVKLILNLTLKTYTTIIIQLIFATLGYFKCVIYGLKHRVKEHIFFF